MVADALATPPAAERASSASSRLAAWLEAPSIVERDRIRSEHVDLGAPIVPALQEVVTRREPAMGLALQVLAGMEERAGRMTREQPCAELMHEDPFSVNVCGWLMRAKQTQNLQRLHPLP